MGELRDEKIKDSLRRLEKMDEEDILSMSRPAQWRLALGFTHEELVRRIVAKGTDRYWKLQILEELGKAYRVGYMSLSNNDRYKYAQYGFTEVQPPYFNDIAFDKIPLTTEKYPATVNYKLVKLGDLRFS